MFNIVKIKQDFPFFSNNPDLVYLDNSATTLKPQAVINGVSNYYTKFSVNPHSHDFKLSFDCLQHIQKTRSLVAEFINAHHEEVVFIPSSTYGLNSLAWGMKRFIAKDDEILITQAEHNSNLLPWLELGKQKEAHVKFIELDNFRITVENTIKSLTPKTKIVSFANITNVLSAINDVKEICQAIKSYNPEIIVIIDAAQSIASVPIDVTAWEIDFLVFSAHKMLGPTGIGVLWGKKPLLEQLDSFMIGGGANAIVDEKQQYHWTNKFNQLEAGTLNVAGIFGLYEAIKYLQNLGVSNIASYINELKQYAIKRINEEKLDIKVYNAHTRTGVLIFNVNNVVAHDVSSFLANEYKICLRSGQHCSPLIKNIINVKATVRASFYFYNTKEDVERLIQGLKAGGKFIGDIL